MAHDDNVPPAGDKTQKWIVTTNSNSMSTTTSTDPQYSLKYTTDGVLVSEKIETCSKPVIKRRDQKKKKKKIPTGANLMMTAIRIG
jgi:hypothetical protein